MSEVPLQHGSWGSALGECLGVMSREAISLTFVWMGEHLIAAAPSTTPSIHSLY